MPSLAPNLNILRTPYGGRAFEGYGEDPYLSVADRRRQTSPASRAPTGVI